MGRMHTVVTWSLTLPVVTSVLGGAVSNDALTVAVASGSGPVHGTPTETASETAIAVGIDVSASEAEMALGTSLDGRDVNESVRSDVLDRVEEMPDDRDGATRIVSASLRLFPLGFGLRRGVGLGPFTFLPDLFVRVATVVLLYQSFR